MLSQNLTKTPYTHIHLVHITKGILNSEFFLNLLFIIFKKTSKWDFKTNSVIENISAFVINKGDLHFSKIIWCLSYICLIEMDYIHKARVSLTFPDYSSHHVSPLQSPAPHQRFQRVSQASGAAFGKLYQKRSKIPFGKIG